MIADKPLYFVDVLIWAAILSALNVEQPDWDQWTPLPQLVIVYILLTVVSVIRQMWLTGVIIMPFLLLIRHLSGMSLALVVPVLVRTEQDLKAILWSLTLGGLITAIVTSLIAVPLPNNPVRRVFTELRPAQDPNFARRIIDFETPEPVRGESLIGGATATGATLIVVWPIILGMYVSNCFEDHKQLLLLTLILGLAGIAMTYTRAMYFSIGLLLIALPTVIRGQQRRRLVWVFVGLVILVGVFFLGQSRGFFNFDWIGDKFSRMIADPGEAHSDWARIAAYRNIGPYLLEHPLWLLMGRGVAWFKLYNYGLIDWFEWADVTVTQNHSAWSRVFYERGLLAAVTLTWVTVLAVQRLVTISALDVKDLFFFPWLPQSLLLTAVAMVPVWLLYQFFGTLGGQPFLFLFLGLTMVVQRFSATPPETISR
jgi:hypothetical protein